MVRFSFGVGSLVLGLCVVGCAANASDDNATTGDEQAVTGSTQSISKVSYSDFGNVIYMSGNAPIFEGEATLFMKNESDLRANHKLDLTAMDGISYSIVHGDYEHPHFDTQFNTGNIDSPSVPKDRQCIGLYAPHPSGEMKNLGAFTYCLDRPDGVKNCDTQVFASSKECLAQTLLVSDVTYSGTSVNVSGQAGFFENQTQILIRNETKPEVNTTVSPEETGIALQTVEGGGNAISAFTTAIALRSVADGHCLGVYEISEATGKRVNIGAFKYLPTGEQQLYFDAAGCLADK